MLGLYITLGVIALLVVIVLVWIVSTRNNFVRMRNNAEEAFSTMDVCLKKRFDLIPNFVETVKGYAKHEKETLDAVISARSRITVATTAEEKVKAEGELTTTLRSLMAVTESYPDLKANTNFLDLQNQLKSIETEIANSRKYYNACVKNYNIKIEIFPNNLIASWFKFKKKPLFEIEDKEERKNVKVQF